MEEKKEQAIIIAREYFHKYGYRKLSLAELIEKVGISKPTFYNYFKNKRELFKTVMLETYNEFQYQLSQNLKNTTSAVEKLDVYIQTYQWFLEEFPIFKDLYKPGNDLLTKWLETRYSKDIFYEGKEFIKSIIEEGKEEGLFEESHDSEETAVLIYSSIIFLLSHDINNFKRPKDKEYKINANQITRLIFEGLFKKEENH